MTNREIPTLAEMVVLGRVIERQVERIGNACNDLFEPPDGDYLKAIEILDNIGYCLSQGIIPRDHMKLGD